MNCQNLTSGIYKKNTIILSSAVLAQRAVKVNYLTIAELIDKDYIYEYVVCEATIVINLEAYTDDIC